MNASARKRILGVEAVMWGEVTDETVLDQHVWLRASAMAERWWTPNATLNATYDFPVSWNSSFTARLVKHRCRLLQRGVQAQPYHTVMLPSTGRWTQCEALFMPPQKPAPRAPSPATVESVA